MGTLAAPRRGFCCGASSNDISASGGGALGESRMMEIYAMREFDGHELVVFGHNAAVGLHAIVAVHSTALGPAAGGCRMWAYPSTDAAVVNVLRLSRGMSYK